jgi:hypothetical protein
LRPAHHVLDFASGNSEIAKHEIVHAGEFRDSATTRPFGFDRRLYFFMSATIRATASPAIGRRRDWRRGGVLMPWISLSDRRECISIAFSPWSSFCATETLRVTCLSARQDA